MGLFLGNIEDRIGSTASSQFQLGNGQTFALQPAPEPEFAPIAPFTIGSYTPGYQFGNPAQSRTTAIDSVSGFGGKQSMLIIAGFVGMGAAIYLAGKK